MLHWLPAFWVWHLVAWPPQRSLATHLKHQSSMNNSPSDRSMVYCHPGKHSTVPFGNEFNDLGQRKRRSIHGRTNYYGFHCIIVTPERLGWVFFHLSSYNHRQRHPSCLLTTGVLVEQPSVLQSGPWAWVGWTQLLDNCKAQVSKISHTPSCSSTKALPVPWSMQVNMHIGKPCGTAEKAVTAEAKQHHHLLKLSLHSSLCTRSEENTC